MDRWSWSARKSHQTTADHRPPAEVTATPVSGQTTSELSRRLLWWSLLLKHPCRRQLSSAGCGRLDSHATRGQGRLATSVIAKRGERDCPMAELFAERILAPNLSKSLSPNPGLPLCPTQWSPPVPRRRTTIRSFTHRKAGTGGSHADKLSARLKATWYNPRTGENAPAPAANLQCSKPKFYGARYRRLATGVTTKPGRARVGAEVNQNPPKIDKRPRD